MLGEFLGLKLDESQYDSLFFSKLNLILFVNKQVVSKEIEGLLEQLIDSMPKQLHAVRNNVVKFSDFYYASIKLLLKGEDQKPTLIKLLQKLFCNFSSLSQINRNHF
jgi:hypothetical protein